VCRTCQVGYCEDCTQRVQTAVICPQCDGLCVATSAFQEESEREQQRDRALSGDLALIFG
jgi:hypothetical protein